MTLIGALRPCRNDRCRKRKPTRGQWVTEETDLVADHWRIFGKPPKTVSTVAIMVDTDDTDSEATAWFDDVSLIVGKTASAPPRPALEEGGQ